MIGSTRGLGLDGAEGVGLGDSWATRERGTHSNLGSDSIITLLESRGLRMSFTSSTSESARADFDLADAVRNFRCIIFRFELDVAFLKLAPTFSTCSA
jgi:hypothetical protein